MRTIDALPKMISPPRGFSGSLKSRRSFFVSLPRSNLPVEPEAEDVLGDELLIPHVVEDGVDTVDSNGGIGQAENTLNKIAVDRVRIDGSMLTVELGSDEDDAGLLDRLGESLVLNFRIADLQEGRDGIISAEEDVGPYRDGVNAHVALK